MDKSCVSREGIVVLTGDEEVPRIIYAPGGQQNIEWRCDGFTSALLRQAPDDFRSTTNTCSEHSTSQSDSRVQERLFACARARFSGCYDDKVLVVPRAAGRSTRKAIKKTER